MIRSEIAQRQARLIREADIAKTVIAQASSVEETKGDTVSSLTFITHQTDTTDSISTPSQALISSTSLPTSPSTSASAATASTSPVVLPDGRRNVSQVLANIGLEGSSLTVDRRSMLQRTLDEIHDRGAIETDANDTSTTIPLVTVGTQDDADRSKAPASTERGEKIETEQERTSGTAGLDASMIQSADGHDGDNKEESDSERLSKLHEEAMVAITAEEEHRRNLMMLDSAESVSTLLSAEEWVETWEKVWQEEGPDCIQPLWHAVETASTRRNQEMSVAAAYEQQLLTHQESTYDQDYQWAGDVE